MGQLVSINFRSLALELLKFIFKTWYVTLRFVGIDHYARLVYICNMALISLVVWRMFVSQVRRTVFLSRRSQKANRKPVCIGYAAAQSPWNMFRSWDMSETEADFRWKSVLILSSTPELKITIMRNSTTIFFCKPKKDRTLSTFVVHYYYNS